MFEKFDGTNRVPRQIQKDAFTWLKQNWHNPVLALSLPTGVGKSAILRAIQEEFPGTMGIVPTNILLDQYTATYPELNYLKGKEHYPCSDYEGMSCKDAQELYNSECLDCEYTRCRMRARDHESTIFNPISLYTFLRQKPNGFPLSDTIVVDEAHKLVDLLNMLVTISFRRSQYYFPQVIANDTELISWLNSSIARFKADIKRANSSEKKIELREQADKLEMVLEAFQANPQDFVYYTETKAYRKGRELYLNIRPLTTPKALVQRLLGTKRVILMSATLLQSDLWDLHIRDFKYLDMPSPIDKERRKLLYRPAAIPFNYRTRPEDVANYIKSILTAYQGLNTVVHLSYGWAEKMKEFFPNALFNTSKDKDIILNKFKQQGGLWIAAGCSEGIDLPGDLCRVTILPILLKPNIVDPVVAKQLAREKGQIKYDLNVVKTLIQQAGRGTRGEDDYSVTIVGDRSFPRLITQNRPYLPQSFVEAIVWSSKDV